jgi:glycosyltransferase involved in cell wall biosynthesis
VEAARALHAEQIEFILVGPVGISDSAIRSFPSNIELLGPVTRAEVGEVFRSAHVFVLPTLSDGFGVTQLEAMAYGLPVITTSNCGKIVVDGVNGFIVPARDSQRLAWALSRLAGDRALLRELSCAALQTIEAYAIPSNGRVINQQVARVGLGGGVETRERNRDHPVPLCCDD